MKTYLTILIIIGSYLHSIGQTDLWGTWEKISIQIDTTILKSTNGIKNRKKETITFNKDSSVSLKETIFELRIHSTYTTLVNSQVVTTERKFIIKGDSIELTFDETEEVYSYTYKLEKNSLILTSELTRYLTTGNGIKIIEEYKKIRQ